MTTETTETERVRFTLANGVTLERDTDEFNTVGILASQINSAGPRFYGAGDYLEIKALPLYGQKTFVKIVKIELIDHEATPAEASP